MSRKENGKIVREEIKKIRKTATRRERRARIHTKKEITETKNIIQNLLAIKEAIVANPDPPDPTRDSINTKFNRRGDIIAKVYLDINRLDIFDFSENKETIPYKVSLLENKEITTKYIVPNPREIQLEPGMDRFIPPGNPTLVEYNGFKLPKPYRKAVKEFTDRFLSTLQGKKK